MKASKKAVASFVVFLAGLAVALAFENWAIGLTLENAYSDSWHRAAGVRKTPSHVALITIDEASLFEFGDDPIAFWTRHHAKAIANLQKVGVKMVGFDMLFGVSPEAWVKNILGSENDMSRRYDKAFRDEINFGKVVLAGARIFQSRDAYDSFMLPHRDYLYSVPDLDFTGFVGLTNIGDGGDVVRNYFIKLPLRLKDESERDQVPQLTLAGLLAVRAAGLDPRASSWNLGGRDYVADEMPRTIFYSGPPGAVQRVQYSTVVKASAADDPVVQSLRDKVVIIAAEIGGDQHGTPYSAGWFGQAGQFMSGPEIHANIIESLLSGETLQPIGGFTRMGVWILIIAICALAFTRFLQSWSLLVLVIACLLTAGISYALFLERYLFPVAVLHLGLVASFLTSIIFHTFSESREHRRIRGLFGGHIGEAVVEQLVSSREEPDMSGESVPVTVLVVGIRNFRPTSEMLAPKEVVELVNRCFEEIAGVLTAESGTIDKFVGESVLAYFGAPAITPDHAMRGLRAALALEQAGMRFSAWLAKRHPHVELPPSGFGIGVHTGEAIVGLMGSRHLGDYSIIGDAVSIAVGVAELAKDSSGTAFATRETLLAARAGVKYGDPRGMAVKGRAQSMEVFPIIGMEDKQ